ncbi:exonuclease subunit SbcD, partial [Soehngenia saccharolytica]
MKFFHLSDLHIGKQLHHYNMIAEQRDILGKIVALAEREKPDAVLIAGDVYDTPVPSAEAVSVFDEFLTALNDLEPEVTVCIIAGNHDSAKRIDFASDILAKHRVMIAGMPPLTREETIRKVSFFDAYGEVCIYLLPFVKPSYVRNLNDSDITTYDEAVRLVIERENIDTAKRNIIVSHQFYTAAGREPETSDSEIRMVGGIENVDTAV